MPRNQKVWTLEASIELLVRIRDQLCPPPPTKDNLKFATRFAKIDWNLIAFHGFLPVECRTHFEMIIERILTYKTLKDVLVESLKIVKKFYNAN
uniref:Uncharacterized protein n=1 Tax=Daphnia galeata TaxID=27404 RepID=A0A8J2WH53_9CRUS|nr:unnamed protein product [Daphnia galeata]